LVINALIFAWCRKAVLDRSHHRDASEFLGRRGLQMLGEVAADIPHIKVEGRAFVLHIGKFFKRSAFPED
jgi:hypothetical protein